MNNKIQVLYVDDEENNLFLFENLFYDKFDVVTAKSGPEALKILDENRNLKVVISDMKMPDMNGLEFIKEAHKKYSFLIFFMLTGYDISNEIRTAISSGLVKMYIQKPFDVDQIENMIITAI